MSVPDAYSPAEEKPYVAQLVAIGSGVLPYPGPVFFLCGYDPGHDDPALPAFVRGIGLPVAMPGGGVARFTPDLDAAFQMPLEALVEFTRTVHPLRPVRSLDGRPNRPLTVNSFMFSLLDSFVKSKQGWLTKASPEEYNMMLAAIATEFGPLTSATL